MFSIDKRGAVAATISVARMPALPEDPNVQVPESKNRRNSNGMGQTGKNSNDLLPVDAVPIKGRHSIGAQSSAPARGSGKSWGTASATSSQGLFGRRAPKRYVTVSRAIVEHNVIVGFTTLLTIYALIGDDLRLICTDKPADVAFNYIVLVCLVVFSLECVLSCIGKDDYYLSFFFWLDVISTGSLVLDLSWVSEALQGGGDEEGDMSNLRGGRTARLGAKAGRVVRVIRLVRILKLYKAYYEAKQREKEKAQRHSEGPGDEDDWDEFDMEEGEEEQQNQRESRVGKKLSEMTIRRVIILVLTMLLVFPFLMPVTADQHASSAFYAADNVYQTFRFYVTTGNRQARLAYENAYLKFFFYHNWYSTHKGFCPEGSTCPNEYYAHAFWIGIAGKDSKTVNHLAALAHVNETSVKRWLDHYMQNSQDDIYNYGSMPKQALGLLSSPWSIDSCNTTTWTRLGMSLLMEETDQIGYAVKCPGDLRIPEKKKTYARLMTVKQFEDWHFDIYFDLRQYSKQDAAFNLSITGFICLVLCVAAMSFSSDANTLVLVPVENMIKRVEAIRDDPLIAMKMADEEHKAEEVMKAKAKRAGKERCKTLLLDIVKFKACRRGVSEPMETVILEKTIIKLGSLLALGFGEAGANIIGANMRGSDSAGVNAMIPGQRVNCMIGCVRIRNFSIATEVLRSKIMTFVNQIAEIVHGMVDEYYGAANKNNGDMFLIIWRLEELQEDDITRLAEMSVCSFAMILGDLHRSPVLAEYRSHPGLQQRLGSDCRVNLSFGLHCGWAIEGAVGSEFKIDASYLSPNVSIAKSIEQATMIYGVPFIVAESVVDLLTENMASKCRLIDKVIITGSPLPMTIHCVDLDYLSVKVDRGEPLQFAWTSQRRFRARQFLESEKLQKWNRQIEVVDFFDKDRHISAMRRRYTVAFFQHFNMGYQNYSQGEWAVARRMLANTQTMLGVEDGPSSAILRFMEGYQFERPKEWQGVRVLGRTDAEVQP